MLQRHSGSPEGTLSCTSSLVAACRGTQRVNAEVASTGFRERSSRCQACRFGAEAHNLTLGPALAREDRQRDEPQDDEEGYLHRLSEDAARDVQDNRRAAAHAHGALLWSGSDQGFLPLRCFTHTEP